MRLNPGRELRQTVSQQLVVGIDEMPHVSTGQQNQPTDSIASDPMIFSDSAVS